MFCQYQAHSKPDASVQSFNYQIDLSVSIITHWYQFLVVFVVPNHDKLVILGSLVLLGINLLKMNLNYTFSVSLKLGLMLLCLIEVFFLLLSGRR